MKMKKYETGYMIITLSCVVMFVGGICLSNIHRMWAIVIMVLSAIVMFTVSALWPEGDSMIMVTFDNEERHINDYLAGWPQDIIMMTHAHNIAIQEKYNLSRELMAMMIDPKMKSYDLEAKVSRFLDQGE